MDQFGAMVRIGDSRENQAPEQVAEILAMHIAESCWSSHPGHEIRPGMPVIASHTAAGLGQFLVGVFSGEEMEVPWPRAPEHTDHIGHHVQWIDGVFVGDPDDIPGAKGRHFRWLSTAEFNRILTRLSVRD